jgi:hypothetical protein
MVFALVAGSCSLGNPEDDALLTLFLEVNDAQLGVDEEMTVTVTARNVAVDPVELTGPSNCLLFIEVLDNQGAIVWNSNGQCGATVTEAIPVGSDKVQAFTWAGINQAGARLTGGFYHIRAIARLAGSLHFSELVSVALE